jgi:hypothetical protein
LASYNKTANNLLPDVAGSFEPRELFELSLLKCLLTEIPEETEYDSITLSLSNGRIRITCSAESVTKAEAAKKNIQEASTRCTLLNLVSIEKLIVIRRTP